MVRTHPLSHCMSAHGMCVPAAESPHTLAWPSHCGNTWFFFSDDHSLLVCCCSVVMTLCSVCCVVTFVFIYFRSLAAVEFKCAVTPILGMRSSSRPAPTVQADGFASLSPAEKLIVCITRRPPPPTYCPC